MKTLATRFAIPLSFVLTVTLVSCERQPESSSSAISQDGIPIHYEAHGSGDPTLLFVHGWSCDRGYWDAQVARLAQQYRVVTLDLAGHGESGLGRERWSISAFGEDVVAVVEQLELDRVILVGHSMGGPVSVEAARRLGDRVIGVVGVDTFQDMNARFTDEQVDLWIQPFRSDFEQAMGDFVRSMFTAGSDSTLIERVMADMSASPSQVSIGALFGYFDWFQNQAADALAELQVPVRLINSEANPTNVEAGRAHVSSFDVMLIPGVGHFVMMEDPDTFNRMLEEIVEKLAAV